MATKSTRDHLIDTGLKLMHQHGYNATGLTEILKAADVPKGSFYHHFGSKRELYNAVFTDMIERTSTSHAPPLAPTYCIYFTITVKGGTDLVTGLRLKPAGLPQHFRVERHIHLRTPCHHRLPQPQPPVHTNPSLHTANSRIVPHKAACAIIPTVSRSLSSLSGRACVVCPPRPCPDLPLISYNISIYLSFGASLALTLG